MQTATPKPRYRVRAGDAAGATTRTVTGGLTLAGQAAAWATEKARREAVEAAARANPVGHALRLFSMVGPCLTGVAGAGEIVAQTAKFYRVKGRDGRVRMVAKGKGHLTPCPSCTDHPRTQYPNGYDN